MCFTYTFAGFKEVSATNEITVYENDLSQIQPFPDYVKVNIIE